MTTITDNSGRAVPVAQAKTGRSAGRPTGSDRNENIQQIMHAALVCFAHKGYAATHFADISKAVGFTRSALYQYFPNKAKLYHAVLASIQQQQQLAIESIIQSEQSFTEKLQSILNIFVDDHQHRHDTNMFLAAVPIEIKRYPELAQDLDSGSVPTLLLAFFQSAIDDQEITDDFQADDLLVSFLGGVMGMSILQNSMGIGRVEQASAVTMAMLNNNFLINK